MHKNFISETMVKLTITIITLFTCWTSVSTTFAGEVNQGEEHKRARVIEQLAEIKSPFNKGLTKEQIHDVVQDRLAIMGSTNLRVGRVTQVDKEIVAVDIVTQDDSMVKTVKISTLTGRPHHKGLAKEQAQDIVEGRSAMMSNTGLAKKRFLRNLATKRLSRMSSGEFGNRTSRLNRNRHGHRLGLLSLAMISQNRELDLTVEQVRTLVEGRLILLGNNRLKMGSVEIINEKTITAEIVTVDNSLVVRSEIDRKTGRINYGI